jgi:hypothetical protein
VTKPLKARLSEAYADHDRLAASLEEWSCKLIRAAKTVEKKRRQVKSLRSKISTLNELIVADAQRRKAERNATKGREATEPAPAVDAAALDDAAYQNDRAAEADAGVW